VYTGAGLGEEDTERNCLHSFSDSFLSSDGVHIAMSDPARRFRSDKYGVTGFFEDIPALIVVVIGVAIFLASMINAFANYTNRQYEEKPETGQRLLETILSYPGMKREGYKDGTFDLGKLRNLTDDRLKREIVTDLEYEIYIRDVSDYPDRENFTFNTSRPPSGGTGFRYTYFYPINIFTSMEEFQKQTNIHGGVLRLTVWR